MGNALGVDPLKLLRPSQAHLDIREEIPEYELEDLPYNPLDIQIFDSLPYAMGIITDEGTPVYINDSFVELTQIERDTVKDLKLWELPCWEFAEDSPDEIIELINRVFSEDGHAQFELETTRQAEPAVDLFFYPTPVQYEPEDRMMWIFEFRDPDSATVSFPLALSEVRRVE